jgi:hypothetical protein
MAPHPTADESSARLHRAGWSVGEVRVLTAVGPRWLVSGTNGENASTAGERRAVRQAPALGMRWPRRERLV